VPTPTENHDLDHCLACGTSNPQGLHLFFRPDETGVTAETVCREEWVSWRGLIHGGLLSTMMDEAMGWAVGRDGWTGLTGRLSVRLLRPVAPGQPLVVHAWVVSSRRHVAKTCAELLTPGGLRVAAAEALMVLTKDLPRVAKMA